MDLGALVRRVTKFTIDNPYERDCWEKAPAITGVLAWDEPDAVSVVSRWLDRAVATQRSNGNFSYADTELAMKGHLKTLTPTAALPAAMGYPLLLRYQRTRNLAYLESARRQIQGLINGPRTSEGGFWARAEGPELWIDFVYLFGPFLALYGKLTGDQGPIDEGFAQFELHCKHLVDPFKKLSRHAWCEKPDHFPQSTFWLRGNCWLVLAAVELLKIAPEHPSAAKVKAICAAVLQAMAFYQETSGYFCHILDDPNSNYESSGTVMFAYAAACAVEQGIVPASLRDNALRAFRVVAGGVEPSGKVPGVAVPPGGPGVPFGWTLFGQGFFLLAAYALRDHLKGDLA